MGSSVETAVLDYIREVDNDLAQKIMDNMFTFDDLEDRRQGHPVAAQGSAERIAGHRAEGRHARDAREGVQEHVDARGRDAARGSGARGPVRVSEVEAEQKEMLKIVRRLADEGQIVLGGGGEDEFLWMTRPRPIPGRCPRPRGARQARTPTLHPARGVAFVRGLDARLAEAARPPPADAAGRAAEARGDAARRCAPRAKAATTTATATAQPRWRMFQAELRAGHRADGRVDAVYAAQMDALQQMAWRCAAAAAGRAWRARWCAASCSANDAAGGAVAEEAIGALAVGAALTLRVHPTTSRGGAGRRARS